MPAYNEAGNMAAAIADVVANVFALVPDAELVVVDDGSRDETAAIAAACGTCEARIRVIRQENAGHGPALVRGVRAARGDYVLLLDSDRQIGLQRFGETWRLGGHHDAVLGVREARADPHHRLALSAVLRTGMRWALGVHSSDPNAPYKLVRRACAAEAIDAMPEAPRIPSILLTTYLHRRGFSTVEQSVPHAARVAGEATLKLRRLMTFCRAALGELLRFQRTLNRLGS
jgi:glycosyltransferase involved in cell wall biosynthesis